MNKTYKQGNIKPQLKDEYAHGLGDPVPYDNLSIGSYNTYENSHNDFYDAVDNNDLKIARRLIRRNPELHDLNTRVLNEDHPINGYRFTKRDGKLTIASDPRAKSFRNDKNYTKPSYNDSVAEGGTRNNSVTEGGTRNKTESDLLPTIQTMQAQITELQDFVRQLVNGYNQLLCVQS